MVISPRQQHQQQYLLPSPNSSSSNNNSQTRPSQLPSVPKPIQTRYEPNSPYPTTFVQADSASFKQVVQMLTGSPKPTTPEPGPSPPARPIPPIRSIPKKCSGFRLYERRNSLKNLKINTLINPGSGFPPRKPETLSPSFLDFPSLVLSPDTPLDPFDRSTSGSPNNSDRKDGSFLDREAEEKAIKEKGFYLHPSPATTPREGVAEPPLLLLLFPLTSPRVSSSDDSSSP